MIVSVLQGGLGNMLFQMAAGWCHAQKIGEEFAYTLDCWACSTPYDISLYPTTAFRNFNQVSMPMIGVFHEQNFSSPPIPSSVKNCLIYGYYQNYAHSDGELGDEFVRLVFGNLEKRDRAFIHVRRADYLKFQQVHTVQEFSYYGLAIGKLGVNREYEVYGDDPEFMQDITMRFPSAKIRILESDFEEMKMMATCEAGIIANSSFSWWAARASKSNQIIAPKKWFNNSTPSEQIYLPTWTRI